MSFWKIFFSLLLASLIADFTYLRMAFFQYDFNLFADEFSITLLVKFLIEIVIYGLVFIGLYYLMENVPKWRMRAKFEAAERERSRV